MARDLFPRAVDRAVIEHFLLKSFLKPVESTESDLSIANARLKWRDNTIAWYGDDGALYMKLALEAGYYPAKRVFEAVTSALGVDDMKIDREANDGWCDGDTEAGGHTRWHYFVNGAATGLDEPILVAGPLTVLAYRARQNVARRGGK
jgi:hypothetical protein